MYIFCISFAAVSTPAAIPCRKYQIGGGVIGARCALPLKVLKILRIITDNLVHNSLVVSNITIPLAPTLYTFYHNQDVAGR